MAYTSTDDSLPNHRYRRTLKNTLVIEYVRIGPVRFQFSPMFFDLPLKRSDGPLFGCRQPAASGFRGVTKGVAADHEHPAVRSHGHGETLTGSAQVGSHDGKMRFAGIEHPVGMNHSGAQDTSGDTSSTLDLAGTTAKTGGAETSTTGDTAEQGEADVPSGCLAVGIPGQGIGQEHERSCGHHPCDRPADDHSGHPEDRNGAGREADGNMPDPASGLWDFLPGPPRLVPDPRVGGAPDHRYAGPCRILT